MDPSRAVLRAAELRHMAETETDSALAEVLRLMADVLEAIAEKGRGGAGH